MRKSRITTIKTIVDKKICCGCGACEVICPEKCITMMKGVHFNYPEINATECVRCGLCMSVCSSAYLISDTPPDAPTVLLDEKDDYFLAHALDEKLRHRAASGGFITGFLVSLLRSGTIDGAIVAGEDPSDSLSSRSYVACTEEEMVSSCGSRYSPVSSCATLSRILEEPGKYAFVGKGCDITALRKLQSNIDELKERIVLSIGLFCAQTPSRENTISFLSARGIDEKKISRIAYRGDGWPGTFSVHNGEETLLHVPYLEAWRYLVSRHPSLRCALCSDPFAAESDISVGDPWSDEMMRSEKEGLSLVIVRSLETGKLLKSAQAKRKIRLKETDQRYVQECQRSLMSKAKWARISLDTYRLLYLRKMSNPISLIRHRAPMARLLLRTKLKRSYY